MIVNKKVTINALSIKREEVLSLQKPEIQISQLKTLIAIDGVDHAETLGDGRFRLFLATEASPDVLVTSAVEQHWGLYELIPEQQSLEDLFIELTQHEEIAAE